MPSFETIPLFDYDILSSDIGFLQTRSKCVVNTINQYSYIIAEKDPEFKKALKEAETVVRQLLAQRHDPSREGSA